MRDRSKRTKPKIHDARFALGLYAEAGQALIRSSAGRRFPARLPHALANTRPIQVEESRSRYATELRLKAISPEVRRVTWTHHRGRTPFHSMDRSQTMHIPQRQRPPNPDARSRKRDTGIAHLRVLLPALDPPGSIAGLHQVGRRS